MTVLKDRLLKNNLWYSLEKKYPHDFVEMLAHAEKYIQTDEAFQDEPLDGAGVAGSAKEEPKKLRQDLWEEPGLSPIPSKASEIPNSTQKATTEEPYRKVASIPAKEIYELYSFEHTSNLRFSWRYARRSPKPKS